MKSVKKFWDQQAGYFTEDQETVDLARNKDYNTLLNYLTPESIVMDFGCATGIVSNAIADKVREIHGIDVSPRMVEIAQRIAEEKDLGNAHYSTATLFDAAFPRTSFDVIYAFRVLHVLPDVRATLQQIHELLKPDEIFISVTTCLGRWKLLFGGIVFLLRNTKIFPVPVQFFKLSQLQELMVAEGFTVVDHEKMDDRIPTYCIVARKTG